MYPQILRKSRFFRHRVLDSLVALRVNLQLAALAQQHPPVGAVELDSAIAVERIVVRPQSHLEDQMPGLIQKLSGQTLHIIRIQLIEQVERGDDRSLRGKRNYPRGPDRATGYA